MWFVSWQCRAASKLLSHMETWLNSDFSWGCPPMVTADPQYRANWSFSAVWATAVLSDYWQSVNNPTRVYKHLWLSSSSHFHDTYLNTHPPPPHQLILLTIRVMPIYGRQHVNCWLRSNFLTHRSPRCCDMSWRTKLSVKRNAKTVNNNMCSPSLL